MLEDQRVQGVIAVPMTQMQALFHDLLFAHPPQVICVTYQDTPVAALLPKPLYQQFLSAQLVTDAASETSGCITKPLAITEVKYLFYSYSQRLAPALSERASGVIEIIKRHELVGAVVSWAQWKRYWGEEKPAYLFQSAEGGTFTIATIRHRLYALSEQFKRETKQGILRPIEVMNSKEPAFVIVSWEWYHLVTNFVKAHSVVPFLMTEEGVVSIDRGEVRDREDKARNEEG